MINKDDQSLCPGNLKLAWKYYNWDTNDWELDDRLMVSVVVIQGHQINIAVFFWYLV